MIWKWLTFSELTIEQLYDSLMLREIVFMLEQKCMASDIDGLDKQAIHLLGYKNNQLIAYARLLPPGVYVKDAVSFGRLAICKEFRGRGLGKETTYKINKYIKEHFTNTKVKFSAQLYLKRFYEEFGYQAVGDVYDEGGIPHIVMECKGFN